MLPSVSSYLISTCLFSTYASINLFHSDGLIGKLGVFLPKGGMSDKRGNSLTTTTIYLKGRCRSIYLSALDAILCKFKRCQSLEVSKKFLTKCLWCCNLACADRYYIRGLLVYSMSCTAQKVPLNK